MVRLRRALDELFLVFQNYLTALYKGLAIAQLLLLHSRAVLTQCVYKDLYSVLLQKSLSTIFLRNAPPESTHENIPQKRERNCTIGPSFLLANLSSN